MSLLQEIKVPLLSVNDTSLTVISKPFKDGEKVSVGDIILVFETSKTTYDVIAEVDGYVKYFCEEESDYEVNTVVASLFSEQSEITITPPTVSTKVTSSKVTQAVFDVKVEWHGETLFSSAAENAIVENGVDKTEFIGYDFVSLTDVENYLGIKSSAATQPSTLISKKDKNVSKVSVDKTKVIVEKLSSNKKREIAFLEDVQSTGLTSTINTSVNTEGIFINVDRSLQYLKGSLLPVIVYETARLLRKYKLLNSYFSEEGIAYYNDVNIGFAVDLDKGLKVLKIANSDTKSIQTIEDEIMNLSEKYLDDTLQINDLTDITFTITDLSSEEVTFFKPLVNMMNSAILGVSAIDLTLNRLILSVTFDHRVTEGKTVAVFLKELKNRIESYRPSDFLIKKNITCFKCLKKLEQDLGDVGFVKCVTPNGEDSYICQTCFKGF